MKDSPIVPAQDQCVSTARWRPELLARRREREERKRRRELMRFPINITHGYGIYSIMTKMLHVLRLHRWGHETYMTPRVHDHEVWLDKLPPAFDGLRILHLTDLHLDLEPKLEDVIARHIANLDYDICLITGDFRDSLQEHGKAGIEGSQRLAARITKPLFGSLGNHDIAADLPALESGGIRMLVNEHTYIERDGQRLYLAGVDDSSYMESHDFESALQGIPSDACTVLLAHAPDCFEPAEAGGVSLMLSGHTHGGQFCLPGGIALLSHCDCPRRMISGPWTYKSLKGYTSSGTGACRIAARYFCRGEIVVHTLRSNKVPGNIA